jgi:hypothetical protein
MEKTPSCQQGTKTHSVGVGDELRVQLVDHTNVDNLLNEEQVPAGDM